MEVLGEIFIWIVGGIAEMIGGTVAENISDKAKNSVKGVVIAVIIGLVTWAAITALGFATYYLFAKDLAIAGFAVGLAAFFLRQHRIYRKINGYKRKTPDQTVRCV